MGNFFWGINPPHFHFFLKNWGIIPHYFVCPKKTVCISKLGCRDSWTAESVRIFRLGSRDPRTAISVQIFRLGSRDPRTAKSVRIFKSGNRDPRIPWSLVIPGVLIFGSKKCLKEVKSRFLFTSKMHFWCALNTSHPHQKCPFEQFKTHQK